MNNGLVVHFLYFPNEVRDFEQIPKAESTKAPKREIDLAENLMDKMSGKSTVGGKTGPKNILATIFLMLNVMATILGLFVGFHASAHQEYDWGIFFSLLTALNAVVGLMVSRNR